MRANHPSVICWLPLWLVTAACVSAGPRSWAEETPWDGTGRFAIGVADDGTLGDESWLDPTCDGVIGCDATGAGERCWLGRWLPHFRVRHIGLGQPLEGTSWLNRPFYVGAFLGESFGDTLVAGALDVRPSLMGGFCLGYDLNHYWGGELRLGLNYAEVQSVPIPGGHLRDNSRNTLLDAHLLYYPWGDARWRPYASVGLGVGGFHVDDDPHLLVDHTGLALPLGCGVKYLWGKQIALRLDVKDNLIFGGHGVETTHNWSLTGGFEFHWGSDSSARYYPW